MLAEFEIQNFEGRQILVLLVIYHKLKKGKVMFDLHLINLNRCKMDTTNEPASTISEVDRKVWTVHNEVRKDPKVLIPDLQ